MLSSILVASLLILVAIVIPTSFFIVRPMQVATVTRLGKYVRTGQSGFNIKLPWPLESVDRNLSLALLQGRESVRVKTIDNAYVDMPIQVFYQVNQADVYSAAYKLDNPADQIMQLAAREVRSVGTSQTMDQLFQDKNTMEKAVTEALEGFVTENGYFIRNIVIDEPSPPEAIQNASNDVLASLRLREASVNKAEALRIERVGEATADAEALSKRAKAFAESRAIIADGMVKAAETMQPTGLDAEKILHVLEGVDWRDALISCSKGQGTIIIDSGRGGTSDQAANVAALVKAYQESA